ncbi:MAG: hypothetical protein ACI4UU_04500 [Clostridia bacterium]
MDIKREKETPTILENKEKLKSHSSILTTQIGVSLIALIVTIAILIILAGITINVAFGKNGIMKSSGEFSNKVQETQNQKNQELNNLLEELENVIDEEIVYDKYGNKITVPKGFKIVTAAEDSTVVYAYDKENGISTNIPVVQDGIVIQDSAGNQFVWIPVGEIKNDAKKNTTNKTTITLGRYTFAATGEETLEQVAYTNENATNYTNKVEISSAYEDTTLRDGLVDTSNRKNDLNATAKDLASFVDSVKTKGGYYIARYEASYGSGYNSDGATDDLKYANAKPLSKPSTANSEDSMDYTPGTLWNYITQLNAAKVARNMYAGNKDINNNEVGVESDLINSYAWDTAIVFIQKYSSNTAYSKQTSENTSLANTGERTGTTDKVCNIYDMASNNAEWSTEYSTYISSRYAYPCMNIGGVYTGSNYYYTATRYDCRATDSGDNISFRFILYIK